MHAFNLVKKLLQGVKARHVGALFFLAASTISLSAESINLDNIQTESITVPSDRTFSFSKIFGLANVEELKTVDDILQNVPSNLSDFQKIEYVNNVVNRRIKYMHDIDLYNVSDYYATPDETMANGAGDCEDFAILKYRLLREMNVPIDDMYLTALRTTSKEMHMVLMLKIGRSDYVLDNLISSVLPYRLRSDLEKNPIIKFNEKTLCAQLADQCIGNNLSHYPTSKAYKVMQNLKISDNTSHLGM